jgi:S-DNA-T family DNA segregation ATPase FtsK/SpoIIIE
MAVRPRDKASELLGLVSLVLGGLLGLALATYNSLDPSFDVSSSNEKYLNYVGRIGSWTAQSLFQFFGYCAFLLPLPLLLIGYRKVRNRTLEYPFVKLAGFFLLVAALGVVLSLVPIPRMARFDFVPSGVLGIVASDALVRYLNTPGALFLAAATVLFALLLITRFSIDRTLGWAGERDWSGFGALRFRYQQWKKRRADRRALERIRREKETVVLRQVPKVVEPPDEVTPAAPETAEKEIPRRRREDAPRPQRRETVIQAQGQSVLSDDLPEGRRLPPPRKAGAPPYELPSLDFLQTPRDTAVVNERELMERSEKLVAKYAEFGVAGHVIQIHPGPVVTTFEFKPEAGVRYSRVTNLADDLCLALKAESIRIDRLPGKNTVGIEVPNLTRHSILLREILSSSAFRQSGSYLTVGLGKLINGDTYLTDLTGMPHLLIAGATGSGKSVGLNCMVCSILYKASPAEVRFIMIDPKRLELGVYDGIPHLLTPIVMDPRQAANSLNWAVAEMEARYRLLAELGVRNIEQYNREVRAQSRREDEELETLPYIVIIVDELADLMMTAGKEVEGSLTRLAQMARAIGIHLILATQRPSVDVLTGLIKANFPCRISFRVSSKVDSRTILDCNGAEQLLGQGDMLFLSPKSARLIRVHGAYISEKEISQITSFLKRQASPEYRDEILEGDQEAEDAGLVDVSDIEDDLYEEAARFVLETGKASTSLLQRRFRIGYGRAARLLDIMQHEGLIGPPDGSKAREILVGPDYFDEVREDE